MVYTIKPDLTQEAWNTPRVKRHLPVGLACKEALELREYFGSWDELAREYPAEAYRIAKQEHEPELNRTLKDLYGNSKDIRFMALNKELRKSERSYATYRQRAELGFVGSTGPDVIDAAGAANINWRNSQFWDNVVRTFEGD